MTNLSFELLPASRFTIDFLANVYNQARSDYLVPMQTDARKLAEYFNAYNVVLNRSWVVVEGEQVLGLAMLGARPDRAWVTRLGVLPGVRRRGFGEALVNALLNSARGLGCSYALLEVIQGNQPASVLFRKMGFAEQRVLCVLRRPPGGAADRPRGSAEWLDASAALDLLGSYPARLPWTNQVETFRSAGDARGLVVNVPAGRGWLVFRKQAGQLSHFVFHTLSGDSQQVAGALLAHLYRRYPKLETLAENIPAADPHLPALPRAGFSESFRRVEMLWLSNS